MVILVAFGVVKKKYGNKIIWTKGFTSLQQQIVTVHGTCHIYWSYTYGELYLPMFTPPFVYKQLYSKYI